MKTNLPVTSIEHKLDPAKPIVTKTDLKGRITYANQAFVDLSGFSREELVGSSHNIVRHPDMPPEAFADLWRTIGAGQPWRGLVKNRCKNGDYYWVEAFVTPITENGQRTGYMSVRSAPRADDIAAAERLYRDVRGKGARFPTTPLPGNAGRTAVAAFAGAGITGLLAIAGAWLGGIGGFACAGLAALVAVAGAIGVQRRILVPAREVAGVIARLDEGQLAQRIAPPGGPLDAMYVSLEALRIHLRAMFADVLVSAGEVEERSRHLDDAMKTLIDASEAQSDNIQQVSAAMEQMSVSIAEVSSNTDVALAAARHTEEVASAGMAATAASIASQRKAAEVVGHSSQQIDEVNAAIGRVTDISKIIRDIADQTNLLALNAAIEAARAGEQGRGFAVVADEVRKLSERTAASTSEISQAVGAIVGQSNSAVTCMGKATEEVNEGTARVEESSAKLQLIYEASRDAVRVANEISAMLQQQSAASQEVANSMERISTATESSHSSIANVGASATSLRSTADELRQLLRHMESSLQ